jgi:hypothetical protein
MSRLSDHFGDQLDWFGRGVREIGTNKLSALAAYKYHIVLENGRWPHYWTEKLLDAYMANAFPLYWGAPNIATYFDQRSFATIDPGRPDETIRVIEAAIRSNLWEERQGDLAEARRRVVTEYHPYSLWESLLGGLPSSEPRTVTIKPFNQCQFGRGQKARFRVRNGIRLARAHLR